MTSCDFSMVIDERLFEELLMMEKLLRPYMGKDRGIESEKKRAARFMVFILKRLSPFIENYHLTNDSHPGYERLNWTRKLHLFMDFKLYRQIKHIHHDNNSYSMAVLVRIFVRFFLWCLSILGVKKLLALLDKALTFWQDLKRDKKLFSKKGEVKLERELSSIKGLPGRFINCYDHLFFPELTILNT